MLNVYFDISGIATAAMESEKMISDDEEMGKLTICYFKSSFNTIRKHYFNLVNLGPRYCVNDWKAMLEVI